MANLEKIVFLDFETYSEYPIEQGAAAYAAHSSTEILLVSYGIENKPIVCTDQLDFNSKDLYPFFDAVINKEYDCTAHGMIFEIIIWKYVAKKKYNWSPIKLKQFICTMQMCGRAGLPLKLADVGPTLGITQKLEEGKELIKFFCIPQDNGNRNYMNDYPDKKERFIEYNKIDVEACRDIYANLPEFKPIEREDILLDLKSNMYGITIDTKTSKKILDICLNQQDKFGIRASELTNGIIDRMTQISRVKNWINEHSQIKIDNCNADTVEWLLEKNRDLLDNVSIELLEMRRHSGKSSTSKYDRFVKGTVDDKIYGMIISFGAHTHRTISKILNLNNLPKPSVEYKSMDELVEDLKILSVEEIEEKYGSYLKAASTAIRGMIIPRENKILNVADYASIEARLVFWASDCIKGLKKYHSGLDLYKDISTIIFNVPYDNVNEDQRWVGKSCILGAGFGLGWRGFQNTCAEYGRNLPDELCQTTIGAYREEYPEVKDAWNEIEDAGKMALRTGEITYALNGKCAFKTIQVKNGKIFLLMRKPSGTFLMYPEPRIELVTTPWGATKKSITFKRLKENNMWLRESTYGGSLFENYIQSVARDIMYNGAKVASQNGFNILFSVYDEVIAESNKDKTIEEFQKCLCTLPDWAKGFPVKTEGKQLYHYQKL